MARLAACWAVLIAGRLVYLQVGQHERLAQSAKRQHAHKATIYAGRGTMYDREGRALVVSIPSYSVSINPSRLPNPDTAAEILAEFLSMDRAKLSARIAAEREKKSGFLLVKRWLTPDEAKQVLRLQRGSQFRWIEITQEGHRQNPDGDLARSLLGRYDSFEQGISGLELALDYELRGQHGTVIRHENVLRSAYEAEVRQEPKPGNNFWLTIHRALQYETERALQDLFPDTGAVAGTVVVMDPYTGHILAMARIGAKRDGINGNGLDLAVSSTYEPGSVFKIFTYSIALDRGVITRDTPIDCMGGRIRVGDRTISDTHAYGTLPAWEAFAKSSNVAAIKVSSRLKPEEFEEGLRRFGLGRETGLPFPDEQSGRLAPIHAWTRQASVSMGYGVTVTAMQLARAVSVIANGGSLVQPQIILARQKLGGPREKLDYPAPKRIIKPETSIALRWMMMQVVEQGTGRRVAQLKTHTTAGKTGTARIFDSATKSYVGRYNGSFVGFAPAKDPKVVIAVSLHRTKGGSAGFGGPAAAPIFARVAESAMRLFDVIPDIEIPPAELPASDVNELPIADFDQPDADDTHDFVDLSSASVPSLLASSGQLAGDQQRFFETSPRSYSDDGAPVPDFRGKTLRTVLELAASRGVDVIPEGRGIARSQIPEPGEPMEPGKPVKVHFKR